MMLIELFDAANCQSMGTLKTNVLETISMGCGESRAFQLAKCVVSCIQLLSVSLEITVESVTFSILCRNLFSNSLTISISDSKAETLHLCLNTCLF